MQILINNNQWMEFSGIDEHTEMLLLREFSVRTPQARYLDGSWDGWFRKYYQARQAMSRKFLPEVEALLNKHGIPYDVIDQRMDPGTPIDPALVKPDMLSGITLYDYQVEAVRAMCRNEFGIVSAVTGSGKTEILAAIASLSDRPVVIIADIKVVIKQIKERLELRDIEDDIGLFYAGKRPNGNRVVVGSIQSLMTPKKHDRRYKDPEKQKQVFRTRMRGAREFQKIVREAGMLLIDEVDKGSGKHYKELFFNHFTGPRVFGFSGTPFDKSKPVENMVLRERVGPIIYEIGRDAVQKRGRIIPIKFIMFAFGEGGNPQDKTAFDIAEKEIITDNVDLHDFVLGIVRSFPDERTLILVDTQEIQVLGKVLEQVIPGSKFIYGLTTGGARDKAIKAFESGELRCLIGSKILKRGLDLIGGAENVIIIGGGFKESNFDQMIGRAVRRNSRGWARVFAFYYRNNFYLYKHSREQLKTVVNMGYETQVVFRDGTIDGGDLVRRKFRLPWARKPARGRHKARS